MYSYLPFVCETEKILLTGSLRCLLPCIFIFLEYMNGSCMSCFITLQISRASLVPKSSYIAKPAASWLDDFLVWISPEAFSCCRKFINGSYCPPDDQVYASLIFTCPWIRSSVQLDWLVSMFWTYIHAHGVHMFFAILWFLFPFLFNFCVCYNWLND